TSTVYEDFSMAALMLMFTKTASTTITDVGSTNNFTINYQCTEYTDLSNVIITDIIPNGMSFITDGSSNNYDSLIENVDGTTTIIWNLGTILSSGTGALTILTSTNSTYISGFYVNSTDKLTNTAQVSSIDSTGTTILGESSVTLAIVAPTISKSVLSYSYNDGSSKDYNVATVDDFIEFEIIYDARNINSSQKDVVLYDYPPLNMDVSNSIPSITTTGDFPSTAVISVTADNGLKFDIGTLSAGTYFTINLKIPVSEQTTSSTGNNLAKAVLLNNSNLSTSISHSVEVFFGTPNLTLSTELIGNNCYSLNSTYHFTFTITNETSPTISYITDGFNLEFSTIIPNIMSISSYSVTTDSSVIYDSISLIDNLLSFLIKELPVTKTLTLNLYATVSTAPIMGKSYSTNTTLTTGTSQNSESSYSYNINDLTSTKTVSACNALISKNYTSNTTKLGDNYLVTISITIPAGVIAYNANITDTLLTANSSNLNNLTLNNISSSYLISGTNLSVTLPSTINSSSGSITYNLNYYDKITTVNPTNYEDIQTTTAKLNWSSILNNSNDLFHSATATMTTVVPNLIITKSQKNITRNTTFQNSDILGSLLETIEYKLDVTNNGLSPAYNVIITEILPSSLTFITYSGASGVFNYPTNTLTFTIPIINPNSTATIYIESFIDNSNSNPIASNEVSAVYKANSNLNTNYGSTTSNNISIIKDMIEITKEQRNLSFGSEYTKGTINCLKGQTVDYIVNVKSNYTETLTNVTLSDFFPSALDLISYSSSKGTIAINNNTLTVTIGTLTPNESVTLIYSAFLNSDYLGRSLSFGTVNYAISGGNYLFFKNSNNLYTLLSSTGRGLKFY
ncbi:MAG: beta strand repeat-containing protein, partial [Sarcina sp.]